jgi:transketolase
LICRAGKKLSESGINVRLVSFPSWELFKKQELSYQNSVLTPSITRRLAVEAGVAQGWQQWVGDRGSVLSVEKYGASAPHDVVYEKYGLSVQNILNYARDLFQ